MAQSSSASMAAAAAATRPSALSARRPLKFGAVMGVTPQGVHARSSAYLSMSFRELFSLSSRAGGGRGGGAANTTAVGAVGAGIGLHYSGLKWQCVEFARRFLIETANITFDNVQMAYHIFDLPHFHRCHTTFDEEAPRWPYRCFKSSTPAAPVAKSVLGDPVRITKIPNGAVMPLDVAVPKVGDVLLWKPEGFFRTTGHVAIVVAVEPAAAGHVGPAAANGHDGGRRVVARIAIGEQNVFDRAWLDADGEPVPYSRMLPVVVDSATGAVHVRDETVPQSAAVLGWVRAHPDDDAN